MSQELPPPYEEAAKPTEEAKPVRDIAGLVRALEKAAWPYKDIDSLERLRNTVLVANLLPLSVQMRVAPVLWKALDEKVVDYRVEEAPRVMFIEEIQAKKKEFEGLTVTLDQAGVVRSAMREFDTIMRMMASKSLSMHVYENLVKDYNDMINKVKDTMN